MNKTFLPVGTVVLLKNGKKRVMITGFCVQPQGKDEAYDYSGCLYPEGFYHPIKIVYLITAKLKKYFIWG